MATGFVMQTDMCGLHKIHLSYGTFVSLKSISFI